MSKHSLRTAQIFAAVVVIACGISAAKGGPGCGSCTGVGANPQQTATVIPLPPPTVPTPGYVNVAGSKNKAVTYTQDTYWMPVVSSIFDTVPGSVTYTNYRSNNQTAGWYGAFASLSIYDETKPAQEGGRARQQYYDQREQDFYHLGDPGMLTGQPSVGVLVPGCTWHWNADSRQEQGGYKIYDATNDVLIKSVAPGVTSYGETGLSIGTPYFRYVDSILVSDSIATNVTATGIPFAVTTGSMTSNGNILSHTRLHIADLGNSEDVEVLPSPAPTISAGHVIFSAVFAHTHNSQPYPISNNAAYTGVDPTDFSTLAMANTTQPNLGTRLPGNSSGVNFGHTVIANCTPLLVAPNSVSAAVLANPVFIQQPTPYPTNAAVNPPGVGVPITLQGSVDETATVAAQATPELWVYNNSDGGGATNTKLTTTWSWASCGITNCLTWSLASPLPTVTYNGDQSGDKNWGPIDEQYCLHQGPCTDWNNYAKNNRVANPSYQTWNSAQRTTCSYQNSVDFEDLVNDLITVDLRHPTDSKVAIYSEEISKDNILKKWDINNATDLYLVPAPDIATCTIDRMNHELVLWQNSAVGAKRGSITPPSFVSQWGLAINDGYWINNGHQPAGNNSLCTDCKYFNSTGFKMRFFDSAFSGTQAINASNPTADEWEGQGTTILEDANQSPAIIDVIGSIPHAYDGPFHEHYWIRANDMLWNQTVNGIQTTMWADVPFDTGNRWQPIFPIDLVPIGAPLIPVIPFTPTTAGSPTPDALTCMACNNAAYKASGFYNSAEHLFERLYTNGIVLVCPTIATILTCGSHSFSTVVWRLNVDSGDFRSATIEDGSSLNGGNRTYSKIEAGTAVSLTPNTAAIIIYDPL